MKDVVLKLALIAVFALTAIFGIPAICYGQEYQREGNTFVCSSSDKSFSKPIKTKFNWKDNKGIIYPIYVTEKGSCFVYKISSKTKREYKRYLGPEISKEVCKELGIEYKGKSDK